jgi:hypothetical protein
VTLGVIDHLDPGQERFVELAQRGDGGTRQLGQEIRLNELEEPLDPSTSSGQALPRPSG